MLEIESGIFYDPAKRWVDQSQECIDLGLDFVDKLLAQGTYEPGSRFTEITEDRKRPEYVKGIYTSESIPPNKFIFEVTYSWVHYPEDPNWSTYGKRRFMASKAMCTVQVSIYSF